MSAASSIKGEKARMSVSEVPFLDGQIVTIERAIVEPEDGVDVEILPIFEVSLEDGQIRNAFPEDLRSIDGEELKESQIFIGGKPLLDLHPMVNKVLEEY